MQHHSTMRAKRQKLPPRLNRTCTATLQGADTPSQPIFIRDLSTRGLGARAGAKTPVLGETVVVTIDSLGELKAMVKWVSRDLFGLHLFSAISRSQLEALRGS